MTTSGNGRCPCGSVTFTIDGPPLFRLFCHCTICQAFNDAPFADVTAFRAEHVHVTDEGAVAWRTWKKGSPVRRGKCARCDAPAVERATLPLLPDLVIVPSANAREGVELPAPAMHIFYGSRVADVDDGLPRRAGFASSQLGFMGALTGALWRDRRPAA